MKRNLFALSIVAAAACFDVSSPIPPTLILSPILDSLFVGDSLVPRDFVYYNGDGQRANPGPLTWSIGPTSVATINATTGVIHGVGKGVATVAASGGQATGIALVAVSRPLDLTLLMDTVVLMQQDTFTIPYAVQKKNVAATDTVWFDPSPSHLPKAQRTPQLPPAHQRAIPRQHAERLDHRDVERFVDQRRYHVRDRLNRRGRVPRLPVVAQPRL
jgi:hypothetical protein